MTGLCALAGLLFVALGVYGGLCAYNRWVRGLDGYVIFKPLGMMYFGMMLFATGMGAFFAIQRLDGNALLLEVALYPFGVLGTVMWCFGVAMEIGSRMMGESLVPLARTFDR